ncbi:MAG TPA: hypothetical protein VFP59_05560 [Candidatus Angelobacter sp.]|nr:hypothetical protein [Candidatus Angelobacter sp.]
MRVESPLGTIISVASLRAAIVGLFASIAKALEAAGLARESRRGYTEIATTNSLHVSQKVEDLRVLLFFMLFSFVYSLAIAVAAGALCLSGRASIEDSKL